MIKLKVKALDSTTFKSAVKRLLRPVTLKRVSAEEHRRRRRSSP